ncbi:MAG: DUF1080 domain-containing protein [Acidobacteria bacterium]|nr:DUF1080 domain-containing protein [Acidobacteriota bacterium]
MLRSTAALCLIAFSSLAQNAPAPAGPQPSDWIQLFNGKDLEGWTPKITGYEVGENFGNTFRVENGTLKVSYDQYGGQFNNRFGHLFYKDAFSYYRLVVEYRFVGEQCGGGPAWALRNSGAMLHGQPARSMKKDQDFPISIEVQLLGGNGKDPRTTANLCTPGTNVVMNDKLFTPHCINSKSKTYHGEQWVRVEVEVHGDGTFKHIIDGEPVLAYEMPQIGGGSVSNHDPQVKRDGTLLRGGTISLQSESHPVEFRKVELLNLAGCMDPKAANYKPWYIKPENVSCVYTK